MNSLMISESSGSAGRYSVVSSWWFVIAVAGALFGGDEGEEAFSRSRYACRAHIVLSSMQMMFSASIGVDVMVTGTMLSFSGLVTEMMGTLLFLWSELVFLGLEF